MSKFKVGDILRVIDASGTSASQVGDIVTVKEVGGWENKLLEVYCEKRDISYGMFDNRFELVTTEQGDQPMARKTFKQLKDTVTVKKNALWQEACDDGTQEYILLDESFNKDQRNTQRIYDRSLVEEDTQNFVEVFQVTPQYMTREELDQWEAFKAGAEKPGKAPAKVVALEAAPTPKATRPYQRISEAKFVSVYNSSRSIASVAKKLGLSVESVYNRASVARRNGANLKTMKRTRSKAA